MMGTLAAKGLIFSVIVYLTILRTLGGIALSINLLF